MVNGILASVTRRADVTNRSLRKLKLLVGPDYPGVKVLELFKAQYIDNDVEAAEHMRQNLILLSKYLPIVGLDGLVYEENQLTEVWNNQLKLRSFSLGALFGPKPMNIVRNRMAKN